MTTLNRSFLGLTVLFALACGGGGTSTPPTPPPPTKTIADTLAYTNPTSGDYKLVRNTSLSSATHLVLDLMGPATGNGRGVAFTLTADTTKVTWAKVAGTDANLVQNGAFSLGSGTQIVSAKASGNTLQAGLFQKGSAVAAVSLNTALARVALDLKAGIVPVNSTVTLSAVTGKANVLPETGAPQTVTLTLGTLAAQ